MHEGLEHPHIEVSMQFNTDYADSPQNINYLSQPGSELWENLSVLQVLFGREIVVPLLSTELAKM